MSFDSLGLLPEISRAVTERGYTIPTPIQAQAIPTILAGRDLLAGAQTGTGKTAGFTLPILQKLAATPARDNAPRALVLVPTRELAAQVQESVRSYGKYLRLRSCVIFGGVSINPQIDTLHRGVDIVVATPGRLLDHAEQGTIDLGMIEILVLDEADRMLDMGFIHDIKRIMKRLPKQRQNLMFSATYSDDIRGLAQGLLRQPVEVEVARRNAPIEAVEQHAYSAAKDEKRALLSHLIRSGDWSQVLVFTRTKHGANRLAKQLEDDGITTAAIHGNKSQNARTAALAGFKSSKVRALVATEVAARGLDIKELPYVVNYELPNVPEDYVHRIGRTGRAGASGIAISLVAPDEIGLLKDIERTIRKTITRLPSPEVSAPPVRRVQSPSTDQPQHSASGSSSQGQSRGSAHRGGHGNSHGNRPSRGRSWQGSGQARQGQR
ncbi:MAG: DEAD/DEAH box helicase [Candidatus Obscuribacterales bacterium]|nr:DEAD/DEAH box helicase [Steroidobacteraceae bacterium]